MRLEVNVVKRLSQVALGIGGVATVLFSVADPKSPTTDLFSSFHYACLIMAMLCSALGFAAFPKTRRSDIAKATFLAGAAAELLHCAVWKNFDLIACAAGGVGAYGFLMASYVERFRSVVRQDPHEPLSVVYASRNGRRRGDKAQPRTVRSASLAS